VAVGPLALTPAPLTVAAALRGRRGRFERYLRRWPSDLASAIRRASGPPGAARRHPGGDAEGAPYWVALPCLAVGTIRTAEHARARRFLADVTWGQYCLYLAIRIADDLCDGDMPAGPAIWVAQHLFGEAVRAFQASVRAPRFWPLFHTAVADTLDAIVQVDRLQRRPGRLSASRATLHARVSSVLKVGVAAVGLTYRTAGETAALLACADHLAIAGQIVDDLTDVDEDLERGRYNLVANLLRRGRDRMSPRVLVRAAVSGDGLDQVIGLLDRHVQRAAATVRAVNLPAVQAHVARVTIETTQLAEAIHRTRVEYIARAVWERPRAANRRATPTHGRQRCT